MHARSRLGFILIIVFIIIILELYYILPLLISGEGLDYGNLFNAVVTITILLILLIVLLKQQKLSDKLRYLEVRKPERTEKNIRKELSAMYRDLGALKIVRNDGLMDKSTYDKKKDVIDEEIKKARKELRKLERTGQR